MNTVPGSPLIVDDDRQNRLWLAARLKSAGHVTAMAENGRQAKGGQSPEEQAYLVVDTGLRKMPQSS